MTGDRLVEPQLDHLQAAVSEQRRLAHMLRRRADEIEALRRERDQLAARAQKAQDNEDGLRQQLRKADEKLASLTAEHGRARAELAEARRERERARSQLDALGTELREAGDARDEALKARDEALTARDEALKGRKEALTARDEALTAGQESVRRLEESARQLGEARRDVVGLTARIEERQARLASADSALGEVADHLRRTRASRSWRWGHSLARTLGTLGLRRPRSDRSALDVALTQLDARTGGAMEQGERRRA